MNAIVKKLALVAMCTTALTVTSHAAPLVFDITGVPQNGFGYNLVGTPVLQVPGKDNVINCPGCVSTGSTITDFANTPSTWLGSSSTVNSFVAVANNGGLDPTHNYNVSWTYAGSESDNVEQFTVANLPNVKSNGAITTNDDNRNNNCLQCQFMNHGPDGTLPMGSTTYFNNGTNIPGFTIGDLTTLIGTVTNGLNNPEPKDAGASLIFSYATLNGGIYTLTGDATNIVVFGFNDDGFGDDNHDDFVGIMTLTDAGIQNPTPIPGALPLFGSVLGGGLLFRRLRKRNKKA